MPLQAICIGHVTCDIVVPVHGWPERDLKTVVPGIELFGGGPAANTAAALAKLGVATGLVGRLGSDLMGKQTFEMHAAEGMDVTRLQVDPAVTSPLSVILADLDDGSRTIMLTKGENTQLDPAGLDVEWFTQAQVIHLDGHQIPYSLAVAKAVRNLPGTTVTLDAGSMKPGLLELLDLVDIVICSKRFMAELVGGEDPQACICRLHGLGAKWAGVTLGNRGSILSTGQALITQPAFPVQVVDTTGAGDAFHGGFIYGLLQGLPAAQCLTIASMVAALKCTALGARKALPDAVELEAELSQYTS